jgi:hypothetical protein
MTKLTGAFLDCGVANKEKDYTDVSRKKFAKKNAVMDLQHLVWSQSVMQCSASHSCTAIQMDTQEL